MTQSELNEIRERLYGWHSESELMKDARALLAEVDRLREREDKRQRRGYRAVVRALRKAKES